MSDNDNNIVPDMPVMRSVRIGARSMAPPPMPLRRSLQATTKGAPPALPQQRRIPASWVPRDIPALPDFYPLERTHVYVEGNSVKDVAKRIAQVLQRESLAPVFEDQKATAETACHVKVVVRLFTTNDNNVVVEVQRRSGCGFVYHKVSKAILQAAKGIMTTLKPMPNFTVPKSVLKEEEKRETCEEALEIASELLTKQDRFDAQALGMQSLLQMTRGGGMDSAAARSIMRGPILKAIVSLITANQEESKNDDDDHLEALRGDAVAVLANCLQADKGDSMNLDDLVSDALLGKLIRQLSMAVEAPHSACHAARALTAMSEMSESLRSRALALEAQPAMDLALDEGIRRHAMLQAQAEKLKNVFC